MTSSGCSERGSQPGLSDPSGNVSFLVSDSGYTIALTNPHVAGSGLYEFTLVGAPPGYQYQPAVQSPAAGPAQEKSAS